MTYVRAGTPVYRRIGNCSAVCQLLHIYQTTKFLRIVWNLVMSIIILRFVVRNNNNIKFSIT